MNTSGRSLWMISLVKEELVDTKANLTTTQTAASELEHKLQESEKEKKRLSLRLQYRKSQKTSTWIMVLTIRNLPIYSQG